MALYLVKERLKTFAGCKWPFGEDSSCSVVKVVEAGFRYIEGSEDSTMCVVCQKELEGWEEGDSPREEHQRHSPQCPFLLIADPYKLTVRQVLQLESQAMEYIKEKKMLSLRDRLKKNVDNLLETFDNACKPKD